MGLQERGDLRGEESSFVVFVVVGFRHGSSQRERDVLFFFSYEICFVRGKEIERVMNKRITGWTIDDDRRENFHLRFFLTVTPRRVVPLESPDFPRL